MAAFEKNYLLIIFLQSTEIWEIIFFFTPSAARPGLSVKLFGFVFPASSVFSISAQLINSSADTSLVFSVTPPAPSSL